MRRGVLGVTLLVALSALVVIVQGLLAARDLARVDDRLGALRASADRPTGLSDLPGQLDALQGAARSAADRTDGALWRTWERVPALGDALVSTSGTAQEVDVLASRVLPSVVAGAQRIPSLRRPDGTVDLATLADQSGILAEAAEGAKASRERLQRLPDSRVREIETGRARLVAELADFEQRVRGLQVAADVGPALLGESGPRRFLLAVQNPAEARASGGIVSAFGVLSAQDGKLRLEGIVSNEEVPPVFERPVVDLGPEFTARYDRAGAYRDFRQSTSTPDFPSAATILLAQWEERRGDRLDGVVSVDPVALALVLEAIGPQRTSDGRKISAANAVELTISEAYARYTDKDARSDVLTSTARAVFSAVASGAGDPVLLAERLGRAATTGHLRVYSTRPDEQRGLEQTSLGGQLTPEAAPFLSVITQDGGGSKLNYYLQRKITYDGQRPGQLLDFGGELGLRPLERARVTVELTNSAPSRGLPDYVVIRGDLDAPPGVRGQTKQSVSVYLARGGQFTAATVDGAPVPLLSSTEQGLSVLTTELEIDPGQTVTLVLDVVQPTLPGEALVYRPQPVILPDVVVVRQQPAPRAQLLLESASAR